MPAFRREDYNFNSKRGLCVFRIWQVFAHPPFLSKFFCSGVISPTIVQLTHSMSTWLDWVKSQTGGPQCRWVGLGYVGLRYSRLGLLCGNCWEKFPTVILTAAMRTDTAKNVRRNMYVHACEVQKNDDAVEEMGSSIGDKKTIHPSTYAHPLHNQCLYQNRRYHEYSIRMATPSCSGMTGLKWRTKKLLLKAS